MTNATTTATTHNARKGAEVVMRSFYVVEYVAADGSRSLSHTFATKRAAEKMAKFAAAKWACVARVMLGGVGGMEVAAFTK